MVTLADYIKSQQGQGKPLVQIITDYQRYQIAQKTTIPSVVTPPGFIGPPAPKVTTPVAPIPKVTAPTVTTPKVTTPAVTAPKVTAPVQPVPQTISQILSRIVPTPTPIVPPKAIPTPPAIPKVIPSPPVPKAIPTPTPIVPPKALPTPPAIPKVVSAPVIAPKVPAPVVAPKAPAPAPSIIQTLLGKVEVIKEKVAEAKAKAVTPTITAPSEFVGTPAPAVKAPITPKAVTTAPTTVSSIVQHLESQKEVPATKVVTPAVTVPAKAPEKAPTVKPVASTVAPTTAPTIPSIIGISPTVKAKIEAVKAKMIEVKEKAQVTKEKIEIIKGTASKEALTPTGTPVYSEEETIVSRTNPTLAQSMFTSRTGIKLTTTLSGNVSDEEQKIANQMKSAPSNIKSPSLQRAWAVRQLVDSGDLPYGFEGYEPGVPEVAPTEYMKNYNWQPPNASGVYSNAISDVDRQISQVQKNISDIEANIQPEKDNIAKLTANRDAVIDSERTTMWKAPDVPQATLDKLGIERKDEYNRVEMTKILNYGIQSNEDVINQQSNIHELQKNINQLEGTKKTIQTYQQKGYDIEYTSNGYQFKYPTAMEAHVGIFGAERTKTMLTAVAEMESPLGIGTFFSAVQSWVTGDESIKTRKGEELAQESFGFQSALREGGVGSYVGKVVTSGAVTTGIILPALTLGAGYGASAISAGVSGLERTGGVITQTLMKVGESPIGKTVLAGGKVAGIGIAGVTTVSAGVTLGEQWAKEPGTIGESLGELGFGTAMAVGGFKAGQEAYVQRTTTVPVQTQVTDITTGKVKEVTLGRVPKPTDVTGTMDILQQKIPGSTENKVSVEGIGTQKIEGRPDVKVTIKGEGLQVPGEEVSLSQGTGTMEWTEKIKGVEHNYVKEFNWSGEGKYIQEVGPTKIYEVGGKSQLQAWTLDKGVGQTIPMNEPTISSGIARVSDVGKMNFKTEPIPKEFESIFAQRLGTTGPVETWTSRGVTTAQVVPKEMPTAVPVEKLPGVEQYTYAGKFMQGESVWGKAFQSGRIFTFEPEEPLIKITEAPPGEPVVKVISREPIVHTPWKFPEAEAPILAGGLPAEPTAEGLVSEAKLAPAVPSAPLSLGGLLESISAEVAETVGPAPEEAVAPVAKPAVQAVSVEASVKSITEPAGGFVMPRPRKISARRGMEGIESPFAGSVDLLISGSAGVVPGRFAVEEAKPIVKPAVTPTVKPTVAPTPTVTPIFAPLVEPSMVAPVVTTPAPPTVTAPRRVEPVTKEVAGTKEAPWVETGPGTILGELGLGKEKPAPPEGIVSPIEKVGVETTEKQEPGVETGIKTTQETTPLEKQIQELTQEQVQEQATEQVVTPVSVTTTVPFKFTPWIPTLPTPPQAIPIAKKQPEKKKPEKAPKQRLEVARKEFLADIASVTASQARYGKATHPALTPEEWAKAEKTGFAVVPTVELEKAEAQAKPKSIADSMGFGKIDLQNNLNMKTPSNKKKGFDLGIGGI